MIFTKATICGICCTLPKETLELRSLAAFYGEKTVMKIMKATGIEKVHIAPPEKTTADYCLDAAAALLEVLQCSAREIDGIVFVSQTPDHILPATSALLQDRLGMPKQSIAFDINYGCSGYVYGLFQAYLLVETGCCKNVLVCVGDTISRYIHPQDKALRMVMGDGASATLISRSDRETSSAFAFFTDGGRADRLIIPAGGNRLPIERGMTDRESIDEDGNLRTQENLYMNGLEIMNFALNEVVSTVDCALGTTGWKKKDVQAFYFHQANEFIVKYLAKKLNLSDTKVPVSIANTGNTGSASIPLLLCDLNRKKQVISGKVVLCGFGVGLSCSAVGMELEQTKVSYCEIREI